MRQLEETTDFGGRLRRMRETRGVTLRQIAQATNHSLAQLEALERNDIGRLPGGIFLRGIVRSYAQQIGLDPEATLQEFTATVPAESVAMSSQQVYQSDYEQAVATSWGGVVIGVLALVAVTLTALGVWYF